MRWRVKDKSNSRYGGRGITIDPRWESFENFLADMGERPEGASLDRIDNDGPYSANNCRWSTPEEQANNRRNTRHITFGDKTQTLARWARETGTPYSTLYNRIFRHGWSIEEALTIPPGERRNL